MSKFDPDFYSRFRPYYPAALFGSLASALERRPSAPRPYRVADIGCGTGHSTASLIASGLGAKVRGVDPDPAMLVKARQTCAEAEYSVGSGEQTGLESAAWDAVTVGSAFHWMDPIKARNEFLRLLSAGGLLLVYEYQFPKAQNHPELNEWIRREFNLRWKAPQQKPRGDFAAVTGCFRTGDGFRLVSDSKVPMVQKLDAEELIGLVLSQSRVLHYEAGMDKASVAEFRKLLGRQLRELLGKDGDLFDFSLQSSLFETPTSSHP